MPGGDVLPVAGKDLCMLEQAQWVQAGDCESPLMRSVFTVEGTETAKLHICGLGLFRAYLNGKAVSQDELVPAWTDYEPRPGRRLGYPLSDTFSHRALFLTYDVSALLVPGNNCLGIHLGNGFYNQHERNVEGDLWYGVPKLAFTLTLHKHGAERQIHSGPDMRWSPSHVTRNNMYLGEEQDLSLLQPGFSLPGYDGGSWFPVQPAAPVERLEPQLCPADRRIREVLPILAGMREGVRLYDMGENLTGWLLLRHRGAAGGTVRVRYAEEAVLDAVGNPAGLSYESAGGAGQIQQDTYRSVPAGAQLEPLFGWRAFRWVEVEGDSEPMAAVVVHADVSVQSSFQCSDATLNWLFEAMLRTYLGNLHLGVPSDCPHRERLGYTGDGQLVCETGLMLADTVSLYEKWLQDILDCQDPVTGHVQHTAPFYGGGGGPGGWGGAIVEVPWQLYLYTGDAAVLAECWDAMCRYENYLESRSENGLVVREEEGGWCLGDWCAHPETRLPEPFVNTYFHARTLLRLEAIARILQKAFAFGSRLAKVRAALRETYYDRETHTFCGGVQGADAFMLDIGLGDERMRMALRQRYEARGVLDTGIFGTEVLLRVLCESGYAQTAFRLLTTSDYPSFGHMRAQGATTLWEDWHGRSSHNHPMFGACVKLLFQYLLGIRQRPGTAGNMDLLVEPVLVEGITEAEGFQAFPWGTLQVRWQREESEDAEVVSLVVTLARNPVPQAAEKDAPRVEVRHLDRRWVLEPGENRLRLTQG